jgi:hypothetical protein
MVSDSSLATEFGVFHKAGNEAENQRVSIGT